MYDGSASKFKKTYGYASFIEEFTKVSRKEFKKAEYPSAGPLSSDEWYAAELKSTVVMGLGILTRVVGNVNVICRLQPSRGAVASVDYKKHELVLVPSTFGVKCEKASDTDASIFVCKCKGLSADQRVVLTSPPQSMPCPAWFVQPTEVQAHVNMHVVYRKVNLLYPADVGPKQFVDELPVFVNSKFVKAGTELKYYREHKAQTKRPIVMLGAGSSACASKVARVE